MDTSSHLSAVEREAAKRLISNLCAELVSAGKEQCLLDALECAAPTLAAAHLGAMAGNKEAAAISLAVKWTSGHAALAEYLLGPSNELLAAYKQVGHFVSRPQQPRYRAKRPR